LAFKNAFLNKLTAKCAFAGLPSASYQINRSVIQRLYKRLYNMPLKDRAKLSQYFENAHFNGEIWKLSWLNLENTMIKFVTRYHYLALPHCQFKRRRHLFLLLL